MSYQSGTITFAAMMAMDIHNNPCVGIGRSSPESGHNSVTDTEITENICAAIKVLNFDSPNSSLHAEEPMDIDMDVTKGFPVSPSNNGSSITLGKKRRLVQTKLSPAMFPTKKFKGEQSRKPLTPLEFNIPTTPIRKSTKESSSSCATSSSGKQQMPLNVVVRKRNLIGDASKKLILPTIRGHHPDLKCISAETLNQVLLRKLPYDSLKIKLSIVDCRYPYEFEAGHVRDAVNIHNTEELVAHFLNAPSDRKCGVEEERNVVVFHCEFSSERGPTLARALRNEDRALNKHRYPYLKWPEIYLLEGGYKKFFESFKELCDPPFYKPMTADGHEEELRQYRKKKRKDPTFSSSMKSCTALKVFPRSISSDF